MQQIIRIWSSMDIRGRVIASLATVAMFAAVLSLTKIAASPNLTLLYSGLETSAAGGVVQSLEQRGVTYEVRGSSIYVDPSVRDELRMTLASEGLPANSNRGYELLDTLNGFGTTSQMFDAAYWRAKEGELARTISGSSQIRSARVHIASGGSNPFQRNVHPTASVTLTTNGGSVPAAQARAMRFLIASAVSGLKADDVTVIDGATGLIGVSDDTFATQGGEHRAEALRKSVQRLLEARVGYGNAVVEVSIETVTETESITEKTFDPSTRVAISTETEEQSTNSTDSGGGQVTVASNLPNGDAQGDGNSSTQNSKTRERVNYEVSETQREILREPGAVRRISVAVLINGTETIDESGLKTLQPRPEAELEHLKELVASAVGYTEKRGDVITLKSMVFRPDIVIDNGTEESLFSNINLDTMTIIQMAFLSVVSLVLGLFVVRPLLAKPLSTSIPAPPVITDSLDISEPPRALTPITGEIDDSDYIAPAPQNLPAIHNFPDLPEAAADPVERLRNLISTRQEETVEVLKSWLEDKEENA